MIREGALARFVALVAVVALRDRAFSLFFYHPIYFLRPSFPSLRTSRNSDQPSGSHTIAGYSPPSPLRCLPRIFLVARRV